MPHTVLEGTVLTEQMAMGLGKSLAWVLIGIAACYGLVSCIYPRREWKSRFRNREDIPEREIYSRFFPNSEMTEGIVLVLWNEVSLALDIPPGKLRPDDRFDVELARTKFFPFVDHHESLEHVIAKRCKKHGLNPTEIKLDTPSAYVSFFGQLEMRASPKPSSLR